MLHVDQNQLRKVKATEVIPKKIHKRIQQRKNPNQEEIQEININDCFYYVFLL